MYNYPREPFFPFSGQSFVKIIMSVITTGIYKKTSEHKIMFQHIFLSIVLDWGRIPTTNQIPTYLQIII